MAFNGGVDAKSGCYISDFFRFKFKLYSLKFFELTNASKVQCAVDKLSEAAFCKGLLLRYTTDFLNKPLTFQCSSEGISLDPVVYSY